jgi:hypothetical protein
MGIYDVTVTMTIKAPTRNLAVAQAFDRVMNRNDHAIEEVQLEKVSEVKA